MEAEKLEVEVKVNGIDEVAQELKDRARIPDLTVRVARMRDGEPKEIAEELLELYQATKLLMLDYRERAKIAEAWRDGVEHAWSSRPGLSVASIDADDRPSYRRLI